MMQIIIPNIMPPLITKPKETGMFETELTLLYQTLLCEGVLLLRIRTDIQTTV